MNGSIGLIEMLNLSNIIALIGGVKNPRYASNKLFLWDDHKAKEMSEMRFTSHAKNLKMKSDRILVLTEEKIYVFNFNTSELVDSLETKSNNKGIISISVKGNTIFSYPDKNELSKIKVKDYDKQKEITIKGHKGPINCLQLYKDGTILSKASDVGNIYKTF